MPSPFSHLEKSLSASRIGTYLRCPLRYYFRYVEHRPEERVGAALLLGIAVADWVALKTGRLAHPPWWLAVGVGLAGAGLALRAGVLLGRLRSSGARRLSAAGELLLTLGVVWVVAMVWARSTPVSGRFGTEDPDLDELKARVAALESAAQRQEAAGE